MVLSTLSPRKVSKSSEIQQEALDRARQNQSTRNYAAIINGFIKKGISEADIVPRSNVFTYNAWRALGRQVCKGQRGVRITTWIPVDEKRNADGKVTCRAGSRPKAATVFHVSQTKEI